MIKLLIGGSPCTHWSIAQKSSRETEPSGIGWELFKNYIIAREKFAPDVFLYENVASASPMIKEAISEALGVDLVTINSALVSAQSRKRIYGVNAKVEQPSDRGILLRDILESGIVDNEKAYCLKQCYGKACVSHDISKYQNTQVFEPVRIGTVECGEKSMKGDSQAVRVYSPDAKSVTLCAGSGGMGGKTGLYAAPIFDESNYDLIGGAKIYVADGKIRQGDEHGTKQGKYIYTENTYKANTISAGQSHNEKVLTHINDTTQYKKIYEVSNGQIEINGALYPIKLADGYYIIRKLTVTECCRLQTLPDDYCRAVSKSQAYKGLGNGWTAEVIIHILRSALADVSRTEKIQVLSMYDGIGTGMYCLKALGFENIEYHAFEIDEYAMQVALSNHPEIIQHGDAYAVRDCIDI